MRAEQPSLHPIANESGEVDLVSIIIGVVLVGILSVGVLAAVFGVIPWSQNNAAKQDLTAIRTAQNAAKHGETPFLDKDDFIAGGYITSVTEVEVRAGQRTPTGWDGADTAGLGETGSCYVAGAASGSGTLFYVTNQMAQPSPFEASLSEADLRCSLEDVDLESIRSTSPS